MTSPFLFPRYEGIVSAVRLEPYAHKTVTTFSGIVWRRAANFSADKISHDFRRILFLLAALDF
jgi:hypothetical protein